MAQYKINVAGRDYAMNLPDGASQDDIKAAADDFARNVPQGSASQPAPTPSPAPQPAPQAAPQAAAPAGDPNASYANDLGQGVHDLEHSARATARLADQLPDWVPGKSAVSSFGHGDQAIPAPANGYTPATSRFTDAVRQGDYAGAASNFGHAVFQGLPGMLPAVAAGAVGGPVAAGAVITAQNAGENVEARQRANNHDTPSTGDLVGGLLTSGAEGVIGAGGLNPGRLVPAISRLSAPARAAAGVASEGVAGAANSAVGQLGTSVGTDQGAHLDPAEMGSSAALQAGTRGVTMLPGLARSGVKSGTDEVMSRTMDAPATLADAQSISRVRTLADTAMEQAKATRGDTSQLAVLNNVKTELVNRIVETATVLKQNDAISPAELRIIRTVAEDQAQRHNNTITEGGPDGPTTLFDTVNRLNLPDEIVQPLANAIRDLNTVSTQSFAKNQQGPFQKIGNAIGQVAGVGVGALHANPLEMAAGFMGHSITGKIGGVAGRGLDNLFGTATPSVLLRARAADAMLKKAGAEEGQSPLAALQDVRNLYDDRAAVGLPPDPVPVNTPIPVGRPGNMPAPAAPPAPATPKDPGLPPLPDPVSAAGVPQAAPQAAPVLSPPPAPTPAPAASPAALPAPLAPWQLYAANGHAKTVDEIHQALDQAVQAGHYTTSQADALKAHQGVVAGSFLQPLQATLGTASAGPGRASERAAVGLPPAEGDLPPVRDPVRWESGERNYVRLAEGAIADAQAAGHTKLVTLLRQVQADQATSGKEAKAAAFLARADLSPAERAMATDVLTGKLLQGRTDRPGQSAPEPATAAPEPPKAAKQPALKAVALAQKKAQTTAALKAHLQKKAQQ